MDNNHIVFGNYTENFNLIDKDLNKVVPNLTASLVETAISLGVPTNSLKSIRDYEIAIGYLEGYGRQTTPLTSENNTIYIPNENCNKTMVGNDGNKYISKPNKNNIYSWKKI